MASSLRRVRHTPENALAVLNSASGPFSRLRPESSLGHKLISRNPSSGLASAVLIPSALNSDHGSILQLSSW